MLKMRGVLCVVIACAFFSTPPLQAQKGNMLFIAAEPFGATVSVDGKKLDRPSPLLLRDLGPGRYKIRIEKDGWHPHETWVEIPLNQAIAPILIPREPLLYMEGPVVLDGNERYSVPFDLVIRLPTGALTIRPGREGLAVSPIFRKQGLLDGMKFALPLLLVISGAIAVREIYMPMERSFILSPEMAASTVICGGVLAWSMLLENERNEYLENFRIQTRSLNDLSLTVRLRFDKAAETLVGGDFGSALTQFQMLVKEYPDNPIMPRALYEIAGILYIMGDIDGAAEAFRTVADRYPLPDLHDRARKGLADCLIEQGDQAGAAEQLDLFSFNGSGLTREEVELYRESFQLAYES